MALVTYEKGTSDGNGQDLMRFSDGSNIVEFHTPNNTAKFWQGNPPQSVTINISDVALSQAIRQAAAVVKNCTVQRIGIGAHVTIVASAGSLDEIVVHLDKATYQSSPFATATVVNAAVTL